MSHFFLTLKKRYLSEPMDFKAGISPISAIVFLPAASIALLIGFRLEIQQLVIIIALYLFSFMIFRPIAQRILLLIWPDSSFFFPTLDLADFSSLSQSSQKKIIQNMQAFPRKAARFYALMSCPKILLCSITFFLMKTPQVAGDKVLLLIGVISITFTYLYAVAFFESHVIMTSIFKRLTSICKLAKCLSNPKGAVSSNWRVESVSLGIIWIFTTGIILVLAGTNDPSSKIDLSTDLAYISFFGFLLSTRIWWLSKRLLRAGLMDLRSTLSRTTKGGHLKFIPSSEPSLLELGLALNNLQNQIFEHEFKLSQWAIHAVESHRYQGLGEIAGLVCHDLTNPLWLANTSFLELKKNPKLVHDEEIMTIMSGNLERSLDLVTSLRSYLKIAPAEVAPSTTFGDGFVSTMKILKTKYNDDGFFSRVNILLDEELFSIHVAISRHDLIHLFLNIFSNSFDDFRKMSNPQPIIKVTTGPISTANMTYLCISDNGSGLSSEIFEKMTSDTLSQSMASSLDPRSLHTSMGLKLVRRLLERQGGALAVVEPPHEGFETTLSLEIPLAKEPILDENLHLPMV